MPRIPTLSQQVATAPLPGVRLSPDAPSGAFMPAQPTDLSGAADFFAREKAKSDQLAVLDADNQLSELGIQLQSAALQRRGKDALGATQDTAEQWTKQTASIESSLRGDTQKMAFRARESARWASLHETVERHADTELRSYDDQTTNAALNNRLNDALSNYQDPTKVGGAIAESKAILTDYARRTGMAPEELQQKIGAAVSRTHVGVVDRMLANGQDLAASSYYKANSADVVGSDKVTLERALEEGSSRGESQRQADQITAAAKNEGDAVAQVRAIKDPLVRDKTEQRVREFYAEQSAALRQQREQVMLDVTNIVQRTKSFNAIPPQQLALLNVGEREALRAYAKNLAEGFPVKTDMATWYQLRTMASVPETRDNFLKENLLKYKGVLSDGDFKELAGVQAGLRKGDESATERLDQFNIGNAQITRSLAAVGIEPDHKDKKGRSVVADFARQVQDQEAEFIERNGKKPSVEDRQSIIDGLLTHGIVTQKGLFFDSKEDRRVFELQPGENLVISAKDVPPAERAQIIQALQQRGMPATEAAILSAYQRRLSRMVPLGVPGAR